MNTVQGAVETNPFRQPPPSEAELLDECPDWCKGNNAWLHYVRLLLYKGANISNWQHSSEDQAERKEQTLRLEYVLQSDRLDDEQKEWIGCWELSKMLVRVPDYIPPRKG